MNLDLREFDSFPAKATLEYEPDGFDYEADGIRLKERIRVNLTLQEVGEEYFGQAFVRASVEEECSRCLTLFDGELSGRFSFIVKVGEGKSALSEGESDESVIHLEPGAHVVDLSEVIREALILAIPIKPLCSPDCKGLCPVCGANLNEETCDCKSEKVDERWEGLSGLLE